MAPPCSPIHEVGTRKMSSTLNTRLRLWLAGSPRLPRKVYSWHGKIIQHLFGHRPASHLSRGHDIYIYILINYYYYYYLYLYYLFHYSHL